FSTLGPCPVFGVQLRLPTSNAVFTNSCFTCWSSSPGEFHPEALTEPCLSLSTHTALVIHEELPPFATISQFLLLPVDQPRREPNDLPSSLHGTSPASSLIQGSPPLTSAFVLSPSWFFHLWLLRLASKFRFPRSV